MRLANVIIEGKPSVVVNKGGKLLSLKSIGDNEFTKTDELLEFGLSNLDFTDIDATDIENTGLVHYRPSVIAPEKIVCAAVNYRSHSRENKRQELTSPYFFSRFRNSLIGPYDELLLPFNSVKVDWEAELSVIIGKKGKYISRKNALDYVAGYSISNDFSWREQQMEAMKGQGMGSHWYIGKSFDRSFPLGPFIVTQDEIPDPGNLAIKLYVNGDKMQEGNSSDMIFDIPSLIENASKGITLLPGDLISTGTPSGVAYYSGKPFLKDGDKIRTEIQGLGYLENLAVLEREPS